MKKPYPIDVEVGQIWKNKHSDRVGKIVEIISDLLVVLYDEDSDFKTELSFDDLMKHWIRVDEDYFELLFNEVDSALCHLMTVIESCEAEHSDFDCAAKHIGRIRHMAEQILGEKAEMQTQAWSMINRIDQERTWKMHGGKEAYEALVAKRKKEMQEETD